MPNTTPTPHAPASSPPPSVQSSAAPANDPVMLWDLFHGRNVPLRAKWLLVRRLYALRHRHLWASMRAEKYVEGSPNAATPDLYHTPKWGMLWTPFFSVPATSKAYWLDQLSALQPAELEAADRALARLRTALPAAELENSPLDRRVSCLRRLSRSRATSGVCRQRNAPPPPSPARGIQ